MNMDLESKGYSSGVTETVEEFETGMLANKLQDLCMSYYEEKGDQTLDQARLTMSIILNAMIGALGSHIFAMRELGAAMNDDMVNTMFDSIKRQLIHSIKVYDAQQSRS